MKKKIKVFKSYRKRMVIGPGHKDYRKFLDEIGLPASRWISIPKYWSMVVKKRGNKTYITKLNYDQWVQLCKMNYYGCCIFLRPETSRHGIPYYTVI